MLKTNLLSISKATEKNNTVEFNEKRAIIRNYSGINVLSAKKIWLNEQ